MATGSRQLQRMWAHRLVCGPVADNPGHVAMNVVPGARLVAINVVRIGLLIAVPRRSYCGPLHIAAIYTIEDKDDADFVKVFAEGVKAAFGLSKTAHRVFQVVLDQYQGTPMRGGYADSVYLAWFDGGLSGQSIGMTDRTFQTGLKELLAKGFLAPRSPNLFWVNPALFFKGDRVMFVKEYHHRKKTGVQDEKQQALELKAPT